MSLREDLASALARAFNDEADRMNAEERATGVPWPERYPASNHLWCVVADECVRQMEAAWLQGFDAGQYLAMGGGGGSPERALTNEYPNQGPVRARFEPYPLALAPPEWRP